MQNIRLLGKREIDEVINFLIRSRDEIEDLYGLIIYKGEDEAVGFFGHFDIKNVNFALDSLKHALLSGFLNEDEETEV